MLLQLLAGKCIVCSRAEWKNIGYVNQDPFQKAYFLAYVDKKDHETIFCVQSLSYAKRKKCATYQV